MNIIFASIGIAAALLAVVFAAAIFKLDQKNLTFFEKLCRNKNAGIIIGFPLICWCVPHTQAIIFDWALPYLWYAAVILSVLSYFYLDYLCARAIGGAFIIGAYCFVHWAFEFNAPLAAGMTVMAWLWGIAGITISAKPSLLRDYFRKCAANGKFKIASYVFFALTVIFFMISSIGVLLK